MIYLVFLMCILNLITLTIEEFRISNIKIDLKLLDEKIRIEQIYKRNIIHILKNEPIESFDAEE